MLSSRPSTLLLSIPLLFSPSFSHLLYNFLLFILSSGLNLRVAFSWETEWYWGIATYREKINNFSNFKRFRLLLHPFIHSFIIPIRTLPCHAKHSVDCYSYFLDLYFDNLFIKIKRFINFHIWCSFSHYVHPHPICRTSGGYIPSCDWFGVGSREPNEWLANKMKDLPPEDWSTPHHNSPCPAAEV